MPPDSSWRSPKGDEEEKEDLQGMVGQKASCRVGMMHHGLSLKEKSALIETTPGECSLYITLHYPGDKTCLKNFYLKF